MQKSRQYDHELNLRDQTNFDHGNLRSTHFCNLVLVIHADAFIRRRID